VILLPLREKVDGKAGRMRGDDGAL